MLSPAVQKPSDLNGIDPHLLLSQIRNTAPFLFDGGGGIVEEAPEFLKKWRTLPERSLSRSEYFRLCLSAHYATVATFVPTDLDQTIRLKLWKSANRCDLAEMNSIV